jgi:5-methyltetrahydrofolate--homocysteine methyltransferase
MSTKLLEVVQNQVLLADGAIGTELLRLGLDADAFGESWNIDRPELVLSVHKAYREAGARLLTTNSFRANRSTLAGHGLSERVREINCRAAELARTAANGDSWVLGSIGPLGGFLEPLGPTSADEARSLFEEQARALLDGGADGIAIETMTAREEFDAAIRAARGAGAKLVVAMMTFGKAKKGYRTMMGVSPEDMIETATATGADVVGSNCGQDLSMQQYAELVTQLRALTTKPIIIRPNAGQPDLREGRVKYHQVPQIMADRVRDLVDAGANIIGGCCGTTPEHIRLFGRALEPR